MQAEEEMLRSLAIANIFVSWADRKVHFKVLLSLLYIRSSKSLITLLITLVFNALDRL